MRVASARAWEMVGEFNAQNLANSAWAFAKLEMVREEEDAALRRELGARLAAVAGEMSPEDLGCAMWGFARLCDGEVCVRLVGGFSREGVRPDGTDLRAPIAGCCSIRSPRPTLGILAARVPATGTTMPPPSSPARRPTSHASCQLRCVCRIRRR